MRQCLEQIIVATLFGFPSYFEDKYEKVGILLYVAISLLAIVGFLIVASYFFLGSGLI
jgi:hypothetical protein